MSHRLLHARFLNVLGIDELEFDAGKITKITGRNRSAKTSIVRAIKAALGGGHDAELIRKGADEAEVVLVIEDVDDPDHQIEVTKRIKPERSYLNISGKPPGIGDQTFLNAIQSEFGLNPVEIMTDAKSRTDHILAAADIVLDAEELQDAVSDDEAGELVKVKPDNWDSPLDLIAACRKSIYDDRTESNRDAKRSKQRAEDLKQSLTESDPIDVEETREWIQELDEERDRLNARLAQIAEQRGKLESKLEAASADKNTRNMIEQEMVEARAAEKLSEARTDAIEKLDKLRTKIVDRLPYGLEFDEEGNLLREGVPFDKLNTEQHIDLAMKIAVDTAGRLGLIIVDGIERLDEEHQKQFFSWANEHAPDAQLIVTEVNESDLTISTDDA